MSSSAPSLSRQVCGTHPDRAASFRCKSCGAFFCAECVTEHGRRYFCASCLRDGAKGEKDGPERSGKRGGAIPVLPLLGALVQAAVALILVWLAFHFAAQFLVSLPDRFHDGTIWE